MVKSLYKSESRWKEADVVRKLTSNYDRKRYVQEKMKEKLLAKLRKRKAQQTEDHDLFEIIKTKYPDEFDICLKEFLEQRCCLI